MQELNFKLLELTLPTAQENLALDEVLLQLLAEGQIPPTVRLWELDKPAVIVGRGNRVGLNVEYDQCREQGIPVIRRTSGGGTVLLGPGCLVFSVLVPFVEHPGISESIRLILSQVKQSLEAELNTAQAVNQTLEISGISDLTYNGLKFSGNSQRWIKNNCLHHGTILYDFPLELTSKLLTKPEREPEYRLGRSHLEFISNLPLSREVIRQTFLKQWSAEPLEYSLPLDRVKQLADEKYHDTNWNERL